VSATPNHDLEIRMRVAVGGISAKTTMRQNHDEPIGKILAKAGFEIVNPGERADVFLCIDYKYEDIVKARKSGLGKQHSILLRNEPITVWPKNYRIQAHKEFDLIINMDRLSTHNCVSEYHPQFWPTNYGNNPIEKRNLNRPIFIYSNKLSFVKGEYYSLRRECLHKIPEIDHYGNNWNLDFIKKLKILLGTLRIEMSAKHFRLKNGSKYWFKNWKSWKGVASNKYKLYEQYKFAIVIENCDDSLTEKIFDAFFNFTIPIYVGPNLRDWGIPEALAIQVNPNISDIKLGIEKAKLKNYQSWKIELKEWLEKEETKKNWSSTEVFQRLIGAINRIST